MLNCVLQSHAAEISCHLVKFLTAKVRVHDLTEFIIFHAKFIIFNTKSIIVYAAFIIF